MDEKGQGAIEYLLIIGAAVIIAVIVIALMMTLSQQGTTAADEAGLEDTYEEAQCQSNCDYLEGEASNCYDKYPDKCVEKVV
jgi:Flp pilus assembly pilin Flp